MKRVLFLATTVDGLIAKPNDEVTWSQDVWDNYFRFCASGSLIVGRKTYELMKRSGEFSHLTLADLIVLSSHPVQGEGVVQCASPGDAMEYLQKRGCAQAIIGGGRMVAQSMLSAGQIDEIQLDIEPKLYGTGIPIFGDIGGEYNLKLLEVGQSGKNTVRVRYAVLGKV